MCKKRAPLNRLPQAATPRPWFPAVLECLLPATDRSSPDCTAVQVIAANISKAHQEMNGPIGYLANSNSTRMRQNEVIA